MKPQHIHGIKFCAQCQACWQTESKINLQAVGMDCVAAWEDGGPANAVKKVLQADRAVVAQAVCHTHVIALHSHPSADSCNALALQ